MTAIDLDRIRELMQPQRAALRKLTRAYVAWCRWLSCPPASLEDDATDAAADEAGQLFGTLTDVFAGADLSQPGRTASLMRALASFLTSVVVRSLPELRQHAGEIRLRHKHLIRTAAVCRDMPEGDAILSAWQRLAYTWQAGAIPGPDRLDALGGVMAAILGGAS